VNQIIQIPDPSLILLIGSAGSGKSTFAERHFQPTEIVSSDRFRAMICDDESDQSVNREAFRLLHQIVKHRLLLRRLTVVDATNLQDRARRPFLRMARIYRTPIIAVVFNVSPETCFSNNRLRSNRIVDEKVIEQHLEEMASVVQRLGREGYQNIYLLDEANLKALKVEKMKWENEKVS
jgi:protein phosphatase